MGRYISIPILGLAATVQSSILPQFKVLSGQPDLVFMVVLAWAVHATLEESLVWAFVGGAMQDLLSLAPLGTSILGLIFVVFVVNTLSQQLFRLNLFFLMGIVILGTIFQQGVMLLILSLTGRSTGLIDGIRFIIFPTMIYNMIFYIPIYWIIRRFQNRVIAGGIGSR